MKSLSLAILLSTMSVANAQEIQSQFPEGSTSMTAESLQAALAGKVFSATPASGPAWRLQYDANGYFYFNAGNFSDSGKWSTKDSSSCAEGKQLKYSCNEFRIKDGVLYLKRDSGEIVKLNLK